MITRFAPAPTGLLHLGHVLNAVLVWEAARARDGQVLFRIEDHDRERSRPEFESAILDDLDWLGFQPDIFPTDAFRAGRCEGRQSDRETVYLDAVGILERKGLIYGCDCTRKAIAAGNDAPESAELRYNNRCRDRGLPLDEAIGWRVRMDDDDETFDDLRLGRQSQNPAAQCGDLLIRDRIGNWTYQFAVTVDDWRQHIDLIVRGVDLLASTGRQIRLARLLGRATPPAFLHHPLIMKSPTQKLSKSDGDTGVRDLRARGWTPARVIEAALALTGWQMVNGKW
ncbi:MAG TPA: glutamate--tRNA ligase family protein [Vicinamibacterales bacterium]|nr:glutamate--tRNA ligase family protein [Vicinamibacterales bacterium]